MATVFLADDLRHERKVALFYEMLVGEQVPQWVRGGDSQCDERRRAQLKVCPEGSGRFNQL